MKNRILMVFAMGILLSSTGIAREPQKTGELKDVKGSSVACHETSRLKHLPSSATRSTPATSSATGAR